MYKIKIKRSQALRGGFKGGGAVLACKRMCPPTRPSHTRLSCELKGAEIILSEGEKKKKKYCSSRFGKKPVACCNPESPWGALAGQWGGREGPTEGGSKVLASLA